LRAGAHNSRRRPALQAPLRKHALLISPAASSAAA